MIQVIIVDDHKLFRDGLKSILNESGFVEIVAEAGSAQELKALLADRNADIFLLDISIGKDSGLELITQIREVKTAARIIMVSMFTSEDFIMSAIRNGADGYIPKDTPQKELLEAIQQVFNGQKYFPEKIRKLIFDDIINKSQPTGAMNRDPYDCLTNREKEVLRMVAEGWSNPDIAENLNISIRTVETHKNNLMQKIGARSVVDVVKYAIRKKIIEI
jgi:DNA-binding NarL/FixJ family response regulator